MRAMLRDHLSGLGTVAALSALLLVAGCCVPVSPPSAPTPPPPASTPAPPPPSAAPPAAASSGVPPATAANPRWTLRPDSGLEERAQANIVPQIPDARGEFSAISDGPSVESIRGGVVLCDISMPGTPWFKSRPDIRARLTIGEDSVVTADGRNNRDAVTLSAPVTSLARGESLRVEVLDRDLFNKDDFLDAAQGTFQGHFPMLLAGARGKLQVTCRHLGADWVEARRGHAVETASQAAEVRQQALDNGLDAAAFDFGFPWEAHREADEALDALAALVGWSALPASELRGGRLMSLVSWRKAASGRVSELRATASYPGKTVQVGETALGPFVKYCGAAAKEALAGTAAAGQGAPRCVLEIGMPGVEPIAAEFGSHRIDVVFADGRTERLVLRGATDGRGFFSVDGLASALGRDPLQDVVLLRITDGTTAQFINAP